MKLKTIAGMFLTVAICLSSSLFSEETPSIKPNCCKGPVLCPIFPLYENCEDCCYRMHVDIGLLYEQPTMFNKYRFYADQPTYKEDFPDEDPLRVPLTTWNVMDPCYDYDLGVTASLGVVMDHDQWYLGLDFDWLQSYYKYYYDTKNSVPIYYNWLFEDSAIATVSGFTNNVSKFYTIDYRKRFTMFDLGLFLSRGSYTSRCYSIEPYMGVYALWYNYYERSLCYNKNNNTGVNPVANSGFGSLKVYEEYYKKQWTWGVGPMFGFNGEYHIAGGLSLFSDNRIAVLYGEGYYNYIAQLVNNDDALTAITSKGQEWKEYNDCHYLFPVRSIIGVKLGKYCMEDNHYIAVKVGYDARYVYSTNTYGFCLNGLYVDFIWDF